MSKKSAKASKEVKEEQVYDLHEVVLAKLRGFPSWPAQIVDPDKVPAAVARERPQSKKLTFYCVRFFPVGDHSWMLARDLSKLRRHEIEAYINEPHKKNQDLLEGYRVALNPEEWEKKKAEEKAASDEEEEEDNEVDELEGEEEADGDEKTEKTKKRKRVSEAGGKSKAKAKKEKSPGEGPAKKKKTAEKAEKTEKLDKPAKSKKNGVKSKAVVESEDEGDRVDNAGPSKNASPPPAKAKSKRDKDEIPEEFKNDVGAEKAKNWRHQLQRALLSKAVLKDEDIAGIDAIFTEVEEFDMTIKYLQYSKIGKVMRHIAALPDEKLPRDAEFQFKDRAQALVNKWHTTIQSNKEKENVNGSAMDTDSKDAVAAIGSNGNAKDVTANGDDTMDALATDGAGNVSMIESGVGDLTVMSEAA